MKVDIRDKAVFECLSSIDARAYLLAQGWGETEKIADKALVFVKDNNEIILPIRKDLGDYALRMAELVQMLGEVEERSEATILVDIQRSGVDVIRIRMTEGAADGTISLGVTTEVLHEAREMLMSAACASIEPRRVYGSKKPDEVNKYLDKVRVGQTERGSYVLTIFSPVAPTFQKQGQLNLGDTEIEDDPFERKATKTLMGGLEALKEASVSALGNPDFLVFEESVKRGVSANLCEAVANIAECSGRAEITMTWARTRPHPRTIKTSKSVFDRDMAKIISEAARTFRKNEPLMDQFISGWVLELKQEQSEATGTIKIKANIDGKLKTVKTVLNEQDYQLAVKAHGEKRLVSLTGDVTPKGKITEIANGRNLQIIDEIEE